MGTTSTKVSILLLFSALLFTIIARPSYAQWTASYGGADYEQARSIQQTRDGGYIVAGYTYSFGAGKSDIWVLKLDSGGNVQWQKTYGGSGHEQARSIQQTGDGGYIVAGYTVDSFGSVDDNIWVLKLNANGNIQWQKTYRGPGWEAANSIQQTTDRGYIVAGYTNSFNAEFNDCWVLKLDSGGNVQWQKIYGGSGYDQANSIQQTTDGGYIVAGRTQSLGVGDDDFWVLKLDSGGNVQWQKTYGGSRWEEAYSIQETTDGGYVVAGYTNSFGAGSSDSWVLKLDSDGNVQWQKTYGGSGDEYARSIEQTTDGGYIVGGYTYSFGAGFNDFWVLKLDSGGNVQWQKTYGGSITDWANAIQQTTDGGYIMAGDTYSFGAESSDFWVLKLSPNGTMGLGCASVQNTHAGVLSTNSSAMNSSARVGVSTATSQSSQATVQNTNVQAEFMCPVEGNCSDGIDNDGDGLVDCNDGDCKSDTDGDGYPALPCGNDCNDADYFINPGSKENCQDGKDNDCDGLTDCNDPDCKIDKDKDGYLAPPCGKDCNDSNASINPGATENCQDGIDNDCDGKKDCGDTDCKIDNDGDGHPVSPCGNDCNDADASVYPGAPEACQDGKDNDCDGAIDCNDSNCQIDADGDGWLIPPCGNDCDDSDATSNPGTAEVCQDGKDNDCDGQTDCYDSECATNQPCMKPDLVGEPEGQYVVGPDSDELGVKVSAVLRIRNKGNMDLGKCKVGIYLSDDTTLDPGDTLYKAKKISKVKVGEYKDKKIKVKDKNLVTGKYLICVIDVEGVVEELDEDNNLVVGQIP